ncbi:hypothetical protein DID88_007284 [Monilinia fructigena]|uniref:Uncharacterized protein n=1 Tax=Monilinia fructigena TaxID=38457 RepID=A0A395JCT3_9HELO|nr:hypothetical protein DID88_007284 [Monilinia fructigena]
MSTSSDRQEKELDLNSPPRPPNSAKSMLRWVSGLRDLVAIFFARILSDGHDSRFDEIKKSPSKFLGAFAAQATWVSLCCLPVLALNALPTQVTSHPPYTNAHRYPRAPSLYRRPQLRDSSRSTEIRMVGRKKEKGA